MGIESLGIMSMCKLERCKGELEIYISSDR